MKPTVKNAQKVFQKNMSDADALCYVPIQKFTIAMAMLVTARYCGNCGTKNCKKCQVKVLEKKLTESIGLEPMFDENFNVLEPPKSNREKDVQN